MTEQSARNRRMPEDRGNGPSDGVPLASGYLRRVLRLEAMPENATGTDKSWVHRAHAVAVKHLSSAKRR